MLNKCNIKKLEETLKYGDKRRIVKKAGVGVCTVARFFGGSEDLLSDETQDRIIKAIEDLKKERSLREKARDYKLKKLLE